MSMTNTRRMLSAATRIALFAGIGAITAAHAAPISPQFDTFGELNDSTGDNVEFGGDGISNQNVAITRFQDGDNTVTLGLTATPRGNTAPPLGNDGAGTFSATPTPPSGDTTRALWSFSFFGEVAGGAGTLADYNFALLYDFDLGMNTEESDHGLLDATGFAKSPTRLEDSQNLGFAYLGNEAIITRAPTFTPFDATANGEYTFSLRAFDAKNALLGESAIRVNVGDVASGGNDVPEPSSFAMLGLGLIGLGFAAGFRGRRHTFS